MSIRAEELDLRVDLAILSNRFAEAREKKGDRGSDSKAQAEAIQTIAEILANKPGAVQILGELQTKGAPIPGPKVEQQAVAASPRV